MQENTGQEYTCSFPVNRWRYNYSLEKAVALERTEADASILIEGEISANEEHDTVAVRIQLERYQSAPDYTTSENGKYVLGHCNSRDSDAGITASITLPVNQAVFSELMKNLVEYSGIDGILIQVSLGLDASTGKVFTGLQPVTRFDYALRSQYS